MKKLLILVSLLLCKYSWAQISIQNPEEFEKIKQGVFYVQLGDSTTPHGREMMNAIKNAWNISKIEFVSLANDASLLKPGNLYATVEHNQNTLKFIRESENRGTGVVTISRSAGVNNDYFYLHFWVLKDNYKEGKDLEDKHQKTIARAELYLKSIGTGRIEYSNVNLGSLAFQGDFCNGQPGYIKNIFQQVNNSIANNSTRDLKKDLGSKPELAKLRKDTLYVPNYWYGPGGTMLPEEGEDGAGGKYIRNMLEGYEYPIKLVRRDDLSRMILNAQKPMYYMNYIQSSADKMMAIVNGFTGETLYYFFNDKSYRPKEKDFKKLSDAVGGAN